MHGPGTLADHACVQPETDTADADVDAKVTARANARQLAVSDLKFVMSTKQGRRFMARLLAQTGLYERSFTGSSETFFKEGRRAVGLDLLGDINQHAFPEYVQLLQEAKAKQ